MPRRGSRRKVADNIYEDDTGVSCVARAGDLTREKRYDRGTKIRIMRSWQRDTEVELRKLLKAGAVTSTRSTLEQDVPDYLAKVHETLASSGTRASDLKAWLPRFKRRRRHTLKTTELDDQLRHWRNVDGLAASTVNHRRSALSDLFRVLSGREATNPVKGCVWFSPPESAAKGIDRGRIWRVICAMRPEHKTRWRLALMHWTGMRPSQQGRLTGPDDFYIGSRAFQLEVAGAVRRVPAVLVPSGKGGQPLLMPLTPEGETVASDFIRTGAFWVPPTPKPGKKPRQTWSCPSANKRIQETARKIGEQPFNVYAIKHSFATALRRTGTDLADIQDMLGHADIASTRVYAPAVNAKHVQAVLRLREEDHRRYDRASGPESTATEAVTVAPNRGTQTDAA